MTAIRKGYVDLPLGQLHYREAGEGDCLLLLHQAAADSRTFDPVMRLLSSTFRVIAMDLPGFGMSDYADHALTTSEYAKATRDLLVDLGVRRTSAFGQHGGAAVAAELAVQEPGLVTRLILSGAPLYSKEQGQKNLAAFPRLVIKQDGTQLIEFWNYMATWTPPTNEAEAEAMTYELVGRLGPGSRNVEAYAAAFNYDLAAALAMIQTPTLILAGELAPGSKDLELIAELVPNGRAMMVPNGTNWLEAQPDILASVLRNFLE